MYNSEKFWNRIAKNFDKYENKGELTYLKIIENMKKYLNKSDIVLDFGCGTGLVTNELAANVSMIHGIDISSKMIEIARKKATVRNIQNIEFTNSTLFDERYKSC